MEIARCNNNHRIRGWTDKNVKIVEAWKKTLEEASFVYNDTAEYYEKMIQITLVLSLILGSAMTVISALTITLGSMQNQWVVLGFNIGMLGGSVVITIANGLEKVYSWDDNQKRYSDHSQRLYSLWVTFDNELRLNKSQRFRASDFIKRKIGEYSYIMQNGPRISLEDYNNSLHKYKNNLYDETVWMRKFNIKFEEQIKEQV